MHKYIDIVDYIESQKVPEEIPEPFFSPGHILSTLIHIIKPSKETITHHIGGENYGRNIWCDFFNFLFCTRLLVSRTDHIR